MQLVSREWHQSYKCNLWDEYRAMSRPHSASITNKRLHPTHKGLEWSYCWIVYIGGYILCFYVERNLQLIVSANSRLQLLLPRQFAAWRVKRTHNAAPLKHLLPLTHINDIFSKLRLSACLYLSCYHTTIVSIIIKRSGKGKLGCSQVSIRIVSVSNLVRVSS